MQELLRLEARSAGLGDRDVSFGDVDRRRTELWALAVSVVTGLALLASLAPDRILGLDQGNAVLIVRTALALLAAVFVAYIVEKEAHLRRLTALLVDERSRTAHLTEVDAIKSQFLSMVSHELKTPLTAIIGSVSLIRRAEALTPPERDELLEAVDRQARRLSEMVEQLLAAGSPRNEPVDPDVVTDVASLARRVANDFGVGGRPAAVDAPAACMVNGPEGALEHVLWNLLDNAYKYGAAPVRIEIEARDTAAVVSVTDAGTGVPADQRERVFERFVRVDPEHGSGMGLGLPIVRSIVEACGGRAWIDAPSGGGTAVRVALPCVGSGVSTTASDTLTTESAVAV